jgi:hypothetical protein
MPKLAKFGDNELSFEESGVVTPMASFNSGKWRGSLGEYGGAVARDVV